MNRQRKRNPLISLGGADSPTLTFLCFHAMRAGGLALARKRLGATRSLADFTIYQACQFHLEKCPFFKLMDETTVLN
jgi:hypothetical protein